MYVNLLLIFLNFTVHYFLFPALSPPPLVSHNYKIPLHILYFSLPPLHFFKAIFIGVLVLTPIYEVPLKISGTAEKQPVSISRVGSLAAAEGIPRGYSVSHVCVPVAIRTASPPKVSIHTAYSKVLAAS